MEPSLGAGLVVAQASSPAVLPVPQSVTLLGGFAPAILNSASIPTVLPYPNQPAMAIYFSLPAGSGFGPRHLVFNFGNDIYVLPSSVDLVQKGPPVVNSVTPNGDGTVTISGAGFGPDSRVFFDGMQTAPAVFSGADALGTIVVTPPQAASGQMSVVTVYNSDGQNSTILQAANPPHVFVSHHGGAADCGRGSRSRWRRGRRPPSTSRHRIRISWTGRLPSASARPT